MPLLVQAQIFNPPYKAAKVNLNLDTEQYFIESINPDSAQMPYYIGIQNYGLINSIIFPSKMRFYDSKLKLIDAVNTNVGENYLNWNIFLSDFDKDGKNEIIAPVIGEHVLKFYLINLRKTGADKITFLTIPVSKKITSVEIFYIRASNNLLIIYINTIFPGKHDYRRIYGIDTRNFTVKWERQTADYGQWLFQFPNTKDNYFYYISHPYDNGLVFSNKTFYRLINFINDSLSSTKFLLTTKAIVDTFFGAQPYPFPDSTAEDYSCDTTGFIVKMDFKGNVLMRKRYGGRLANPLIIYPITKDSLFFDVLNRVNNSVEIKLFVENQSKIKTIKHFNHNNLISIWRDGNYLYFSDAHKLWKNNIYRLNAKTDTIFSKYMYSPLASNSNYFINYGDKFYHIFNKQFEKIAEIPFSGYGSYLTYLKSLNIFAELSNNSTMLYKLKKLSLRERLNETTFKWISTTTIVLLVVILLLWIYTMKLSRKKIEKNYKLLQISKKELETATSQLVRSEKLAVLGTIASGVAHQLNSPLGAILNSAQRLKSTDDFERNINLIKKAAIRSKNIVERFLNASRPIDDKQSKTDLSHSVHEFWELFSHQFEISDITIKKNIECNVFIKINPGYFNEVLTNILFNARDSIVENESDERTILLNCNVVDNNVIIEVKDTGSGFSDLILHSGFEAFLTTKERGKGTGLGLWLVEKIVSDAGGKVELGNYDKGAFVRIMLQIAD